MTENSNINEPGIEARVGARWWADKIRVGFFPDNGAEPSDATKSPLALGMIATLQRKELEGVTPEKIDAYEAALARQIQAIIEKHGHATYASALALRCDYGPGEAHVAALEEAGIKPGMTVLPWKTTMWVEPGCVEVGDGYAAAPKELSLDPPPSGVASASALGPLY